MLNQEIILKIRLHYYKISAMENINTIVGWKEWVALPTLNIPFVKAKVDTGAQTSSIHAYGISYKKKNDITIVDFEIHPLQENNRISIKCSAELLEFREVKSSNGKSEMRPVIKTLLQIGGHIVPIELNLTNRDSMGMRMLIGREALAQALVNPSDTFLHGKLSKKEVLKIYGK